jgi:hypothetical protein
MKLGFLMLCHTALERAAQVARYWAVAGSPVVIHVDAKVRKPAYDRMVSTLADLPNVRFCGRTKCEWGTWGIVAATQTAAEMMLRDFPQARHVYLASGSCLPLRPVGELAAYLDARPQTDFIESVTTSDVGWTIGGLNIERFTLRFPFSWRRQRALFDLWVRTQRALRLTRGVPDGIAPHLGSQWWCLTRATLSAILEAPDRGAMDRYFRRVWIPDESYFQTLARRVSSRIESRSLTLSKFDFQGKPHIFYDDHLQLLRRSDCFVARKMWPQADRLYRTFLSPDAGGQAGEPNPGKIDRLFAKAVERRTKGRAGLYMQSRFPRRDWENGKTAGPYSIFQGFAEVLENFDTWLSKVAGARVHGRLFAPDRVHFAGNELVYNGGLSCNAALRDYSPKAFLTNLVWTTRGERQCFQMRPDDVTDVLDFIATDPNAHLSVISGAWAVPLFRSGLSFGAAREQAATLQKQEADMLALLRKPQVKARVRIMTLAEFVENPMEPLQAIVDEVTPRSVQRRLTEVPQMADLTGFGQFLQNLRNQGMQPVLMGEFPALDGAPPAGGRRSRPYLVK